MVSQQAETSRIMRPIGSYGRKVAVWAYIVMLAWVPFPLGSAVTWGAGAFEMLVAVCWTLWLLANIADPAVMLPRAKSLFVPLALFTLALSWAIIQTLPVLPHLANPLWAMASDALKQPLPAIISINPWRTVGEFLKLTAYGAACWLAFSMAQDRARARLLFHAVMAIGAAYALYGFVLALADTAQAQIIYRMKLPNPFLSGPFMLHNSFATYCGLTMLAATCLLVSNGADRMVLGRGWRRLGLSVLNYVSGTGAIYLLATLLTFAAVAASSSRGGFASTVTALFSLAVLGLILARRSAARFGALAGLIAALLPFLLFVAINNDALSSRFNEVLDAGTADDVRLTLWAAARRMIDSAPLQGLGLGTFQDAYPLYSQRVLPFVMDKAHNDYLELAAGLGLPAAAAIWIALAWCALFCLRGAFVRRRDRQYAMAGFCAAILVAVHSSVDFSLQLPAVGLVFATLLGIGLAQSSRSRNAPGSAHAHG